MNVLRHNHITDDDKAISAANLFKDFEKLVTNRSLSQQRLATITTEGDEVEVSVPVVTLKMAIHRENNTNCDL